MRGPPTPLAFVVCPDCYATSCLDLRTISLNHIIKLLVRKRDEKKRVREGNAGSLTVIAPYTEGDVKGDIYVNREYANTNAQTRT